VWFNSIWLRLAALGWLCVFSPFFLFFFTFIYLDSPLAAFIYLYW